MCSRVNTVSINEIQFEDICLCGKPHWETIPQKELKLGGVISWLGLIPVCNGMMLHDATGALGVIEKGANCDLESAVTVKTCQNSLRKFACSKTPLLILIEDHQCNNSTSAWDT